MSAFDTQLTRRSTNSPEVQTTFGVLCTTSDEYPDSVLVVCNSQGRYLPTAPFSGFEQISDLAQALVDISGLRAVVRAAEQVDCEALVLANLKTPDSAACFQPIKVDIEITGESELQIDAKFILCTKVEELMKLSGSGQVRLAVARYALRKAFPDYFRY